MCFNTGCTIGYGIEAQSGDDMCDACMRLLQPTVVNRFYNLDLGQPTKTVLVDDWVDQGGYDALVTTFNGEAVPDIWEGTWHIVPSCQVDPGEDNEVKLCSNCNADIYADYR